MFIVISVSWLFSLLLLPLPAYSAVFNVSPGDVTGLIAAINAANNNGQDNTINITGTYVLPAVADATDGGNGLPSITSSMTIEGGIGATLKRSDAAETPFFRILRVAETANLTINGLTIEGGLLPHVNFAREGTGAGILSFGDLTVINSAILDNFAGDETGGIASVQAGTFIMRNSIISGNGTTNAQGPAGISVGGPHVSIRASTISENFGIGLVISGVNEHGEFSEDINAELVNSFIFHNHALGRIGGVAAGGGVMIINSTIAENIGGSGALDAAAVLTSGRLLLVNDTIVNNTTPSLDPLSTGGILADPENNGRIELVNTILAGNTRTGVASDCGGAPITSLGNNIIGSTAGCAVSLVATDQIGDPKLGTLIDDGTPGNGHFPLPDTSPAIDAGNNDICLSNPVLATDQIGEPRVGVCDIGAIEFQPAATVLTVGLDVKPGSRENTVNPKSKGIIPVAILSRNSFDASTVDPASVKFGPNQALATGRGQFKDVNGDGLPDIVLHFRTQDTGIQCGDTSVSITGETLSGIPIQGSDTIRTVGCKRNDEKEKDKNNHKKDGH